MIEWLMVVYLMDTHEPTGTRHVFPDQEACESARKYWQDWQAQTSGTYAICKPVTRL
jgi:hypothetical protein